MKFTGTHDRWLAEFGKFTIACTGRGYRYTETTPRKSRTVLFGTLGDALTEVIQRGGLEADCAKVRKKVDALAKKAKVTDLEEKLAEAQA